MSLKIPLIGFYGKNLPKIDRVKLISFTFASQLDFSKSFTKSIQKEDLILKIFKTFFQNLSENDFSGLILTSQIELDFKYLLEKYFDNTFDSNFILSFFQSQFPHLPIIFFKKFQKIDQKDTFLKSVYAFQNFNQVLHIRELVDFHSSYKYILMENSPCNQKRLGQFIADQKKMDFNKLKEKYLSLFMQTLKLKTDDGKRVNVFQHLLGYFKKNLTEREKFEMKIILEKFKEGRVTYLSVVNKIGFLSLKYQEKYLLKQRYFNPFS